MPLDEKTIEKLRGDLTDEEVSLIAWDKLQVYVREAVLGQPGPTRTELLNQGEAEYRLTPFDEHGFTTVSFEGQDLLRLHWTRLRKGMPFKLSDMKKVEE